MTPWSVFGWRHALFKITTLSTPQWGCSGSPIVEGGLGLGICRMPFWFQVYIISPVTAFACCEYSFALLSHSRLSSVPHSADLNQKSVTFRKRPLFWDRLGGGSQRLAWSGLATVIVQSSGWHSSVGWTGARDDGCLWRPVLQLKVICLGSVSAPERCD